MRTWNNVPATIGIEVYRDTDGQWIEVAGKHDIVLPDWLPMPAVGQADDYGEIVLELRLSGYYEPQTYAHPSEFCNEIEVERIVVKINGEHDIVLTDRAVLDNARGYWDDRISDCDVPRYDYDPYDYDQIDRGAI